MNWYLIAKADNKFPIYESEGITYAPPTDSAFAGLPLYEVNAKKLESLWAKNPSYVSKQDLEALQKNRVKNMDFVSDSSNVIFSPIIVVDGNGNLDFRDGRHRAAKLIQMGKGRIIVAVLDSDAQWLNFLEARKVSV